MNIHIKIIEHLKQRYPTVGDWWFDDRGDLQVRVSKMSDGRYEQLVALHEVVEALACAEDGVDQDDVTAFDMEFEAARKIGDESEPGDDKRAPYYKQHQTATAIERLMAVTLGVDWNEYDKEVASL